MVVCVSVWWFAACGPNFIKLMWHICFTPHFYWFRFRNICTLLASGRPHTHTHTPMRLLVYYNHTNKWDTFTNPLLHSTYGKKHITISISIWMWTLKYTKHSHTNTKRCEWLYFLLHFIVPYCKAYHLPNIPLVVRSRQNREIVEMVRALVCEYVYK